MSQTNRVIGITLELTAAGVKGTLKSVESALKGVVGAGKTAGAQTKKLGAALSGFSSNIGKNVLKSVKTLSGGLESTGRKLTGFGRALSINAFVIGMVTRRMIKSFEGVLKSIQGIIEESADMDNALTFITDTLTALGLAGLLTGEKTEEAVAVFRDSFDISVKLGGVLANLGLKFQKLKNAIARGAISPLKYLNYLLETQIDIDGFAEALETATRKFLNPIVLSIQQMLKDDGLPGLIDKLNVIADIGAGFATGFLDGVNDMLNLLMDLVGDDTEGLKAAAHWLGELAAKMIVFAPGGALIGSVIGGIGQVLLSLGGAVSAIVGPAGLLVALGLLGAKAAGVDFGSLIPEGLGEVFKNVTGVDVGGFIDVDALRTRVDEAVGVVENKFNNISWDTVFSDLYTYWTQFKFKVAGWVGDSTEAFLNAFGDTDWNTVFNSLQTWLNNVGTFITENITDIASEFRMHVDEIDWDNVFYSFGQFLTNIALFITNNISGLADAFITAFNDIEWGEVLKDAGEAFKNAFLDIARGSASAWEHDDGFARSVLNVVDGIKTKFSDGFKSIQEALVAWAESPAWNTTWDSWGELFTDVMEGVKDKVFDILAAIGKKLEQTIELIRKLRSGDFSVKDTDITLPDTGQQRQGGGYIHRTGKYLLHRGEMVTTRQTLQSQRRQPVTLEINIHNRDGSTNRELRTVYLPL